MIIHSAIYSVVFENEVNFLWETGYIYGSRFPENVIFHNRFFKNLFLGFVYAHVAIVGNCWNLKIYKKYMNRGVCLSL